MILAALTIAAASPPVLTEEELSRSCVWTKVQVTVKKSPHRIGAKLKKRPPKAEIVDWMQECKDQRLPGPGRPVTLAEPVEPIPEVSPEWPLPDMWAIPSIQPEPTVVRDEEPGTPVFIPPWEAPTSPAGSGYVYHPTQPIPEPWPFVLYPLGIAALIWELKRRKAK